jgi:hypothetical protein
VTFADVCRIAGVLLLIAALVFLVLGVTALECLVVAVVGLGLSRVAGP